MYKDLRVTTLLCNIVEVGEVLLVACCLKPGLCCIIKPMGELSEGVVILHELFHTGAGIAQQQGVVDQFLGSVIVTPVYAVSFIDHLVCYIPGEVEEMITTLAWGYKKNIIINDM